MSVPTDPRKPASLLAVVALLLLSAPAPAQEEGRFHGARRSPQVDYQALYDEAAPLDESEEGQAVLDGCVAAYGGRDKLETLRGFRLHYVGADDPAKSKTRSFARGRRYRHSSGGRDRILNGRECWATDGEVVAPMDDGRYRAELFSYLTLAMPLAALDESFTGIRYGKKEEDPRDYLYFAKSDSLMMVLGLDPDTHRIVSSTGIVPQQSTRFVFVNEFSDFREVDGYLFPHRLVNISMGLRVGESVLDRVEVNPPFDEDEFRPAPGGESDEDGTDR